MIIIEHGYTTEDARNLSGRAGTVRRQDGGDLRGRCLS